MSAPFAPSRRSFLAALAATTACRPGTEANPPSPAPTPRTPCPDATGPDGPISPETLAEAEKLFAVEYTPRERAQILETLEDQLTRTVALRRHDPANALAPATVFDPRLPGQPLPVRREVLRLPRQRAIPLPSRDEDIAFAPATQLSRWLRDGKLTSERLTELYLDRLRALGPELRCVVTLTEDLALEQAKTADAELRRGKVRGPLHGVPWGAKDLLDTEDLETTWGATPYRDRIAKSNAVVVQRLERAGAVLVAKLTLGALAYGDIWFDGITRNPWDPREGSSGSSAGSAAATAAGLVGFALGTETLGSIVSPSMRCGTTGLRPTFGRVARTGAMALCWSLDKIGPICRNVTDCAAVLAAIEGPDPGDPASLDVPLELDLRGEIEGLRVGYDPKWFESEQANDIDREALQTARELGVQLVPIELPSMPYDALLGILFAESAAAFEQLTLSDRDATLRWQEPEAWPNSFRSARFISAIEFVQAQRLRRDVMRTMHERFEQVDLLISPSYADSLLTITNFTGHPSITLRAGFEQRKPQPMLDDPDDRDPEGRADKSVPPREVPHGITLWGRLFDEGTLMRFALALQHRLGVWDRRPPMAAG